MNENVKIENKIFPADEYEALAIAYVNAQGLSGKSPAEVYRIYYSTLKEIKEEHNKIAAEEKAEKRKKLI